MKFVTSTILIIVCLSVSVHTQSPEEIAIRDHFSKRCQKYSANAVSYDELTEQVSTFVKYSDYALTTLMVDTNDFCNEIRPVLENTFNSLADRLYPCLPKDEKYLRKFLRESFHEVMEYLCKNNGRTINNFKSTHGQQCRTSLAQANASQEINNCLNKIFAPLRDTVKKNELCEDISVTKKCFSQVLHLHCPDFTSFHLMNNQLFEAISKPCSACSFSFTVLLLVFSVFITKLF